jgi:hypothetical protein
MAINWNLGPSGGEAGEALAQGFDRFGASIMEAMKYREQKNRQEMLDRQAREHQQFLETNATNQLNLQQDKWQKEQDQTKLQEENRLRTAQMSQVNPLLDSGDEQGAIRAAQTLGIGADRTQNVTSAVPTKDIDEALGGYTGNVATPSDTIKFRVGDKELTSFNRDESYKRYSEESNALADSYTRAASDPGMSSDPIAVAANTYTAAALRAATASPKSQLMSSDELQKFAKAKQDEYFKFDSATQARLLAKAKLEEARASHAASNATRAAQLELAKSTRESSNAAREQAMALKDTAADTALSAASERIATSVINGATKGKEIKDDLINVSTLRLNIEKTKDALAYIRSNGKIPPNLLTELEYGTAKANDPGGKVSDADLKANGFITRGNGILTDLRNQAQRWLGGKIDPKTLELYLESQVKALGHKTEEGSTLRNVSNNIQKQVALLIDRGDKASLYAAQKIVAKAESEPALAGDQGALDHMSLLIEKRLSEPQSPTRKNRISPTAPPAPMEPTKKLTIEGDIP